MTAAKTDTRLGALYRRIARKRGKQKAIVAVSRVICEIAWILICDPGARYQELGPDYYRPRSPARQTRDKIREIERLNPGKKVVLADADPGVTSGPPGRPRHRTGGCLATVTGSPRAGARGPRPPVAPRRPPTGPGVMSSSARCRPRRPGSTT